MCDIGEINPSADVEEERKKKREMYNEAKSALGYLAPIIYERQ